MTLYEFNQLSQDDKANFVWENCVFLMNYVEDTTHAASLYYRKAAKYRQEFFIELWYNVADNCVDSIVSFRTTKRLGPYLEIVKLEGI